MLPELFDQMLKFFCFKGILPMRSFLSICDIILRINLFSWKELVLLELFLLGIRGHFCGKIMFRNGAKLTGRLHCNSRRDALIFG